MINSSFKKFPHFTQLDHMDCGPTCLRIISKYYGKFFNLQTLRNLSKTTRVGSSMLGLLRAAEKLGFNSFGAKVDIEMLQNEIDLPCVVHWNQNHFTVLYKITKTKVYTSDPAKGLLVYSIEEFMKGWSGGAEVGVILMLEPTPAFYAQEEEENGLYNGIGFLLPFMKKYKSYGLHLLFGLLLGGALQLAFPYLTQSIVDKGIKEKNVDLIYLILAAQLFLFLGKISIEIVRGWILVHISARLNISMLSNFFIKLMKLPLSFFDVKMTGDLLQRINDHKRIEQTITSNSISTLISCFNLFLFGIVLARYNTSIFLIFLFGSVLNFIWIYFFIKRRGDLDYKRFNQLSANQSKTIELINGMQEIKLNNAEKEKRWQWERFQTKLFRTNIQSLALDQVQNIGSLFINELKNIIITVIAAQLVIKGELTIGMLLSISYIIGQLNSPITQLVSFVQSFQDAKLSLERIAEIHGKEEECNKSNSEVFDVEDGVEIELNNLTFSYSGPQENIILKNVSFTIPRNKVTAIVGASGSGKTTLMKILLNFYKPTAGEILVNNKRLSTVSDEFWRDVCGSVLQEGFIFSDTIEKNIAVGVEFVDYDRLQHALKVANVESLVNTLALGLQTKIGQEGIGLSSGQKQRLLIARAIYKEPQVLFFDEATSALDSKNEKEIVQNLDNFFQQKTVVVIAHRLSTVKAADQIVVLDDGRVQEIGTHLELIEKRGYYYELVKSQLSMEPAPLENLHYKSA
ncbi:ATP-binding cassette, subfamily B [Pedobacter steynii]|uniref:ATP-binding cassette, subfamily B n=1 Tax=Pedobacter steynii TaxID=430522 RepID=A0A1G9JBU5_9SPHI|nr:peptidase domain-containing ABC transporter [Pedobacter steynii]NQX38198.1 peptidase domain-containing ABC transporter [Pedobacter steynii]SDL34663.1 ATP-binding cassette, subfamily B [Pedobacter steynii]